MPLKTATDEVAEGWKLLEKSVRWSEALAAE